MSQVKWFQNIGGALHEQTKERSNGFKILEVWEVGCWNKYKEIKFTV